MAQAKVSTRKSKITVPERCHPLVKVVFAEMRRQAITYLDLEWRSGVLVSTFKAWRNSNLPSIPTIEAALGVCGYDLLPVPKPERLDPTVRADLEAVAAKHGLEVIPHRELVAACIGYHPHPGSHIDARRRRKAAKRQSPRSADNLR